MLLSSFIQAPRHGRRGDRRLLILAVRGQSVCKYLPQLEEIQDCVHILSRREIVTIVICRLGIQTRRRVSRHHRRHQHGRPESAASSGHVPAACGPSGQTRGGDCELAGWLWTSDKPRESETGPGKGGRQGRDHGRRVAAGGGGRQSPDGPAGSVRKVSGPAHGAL
jgi:hypothetical protein